MRTLLILIFTTTLVHAADRESLYGEWGTEAQCARAPIIPTGTKLAAPFEIKPDWLGHGEVWCRLKWGNASSESDGLFVTATGLCGEDSVRGYRINFRLRGDELTLSWNQWHKVGPLKRCE